MALKTLGGGNLQPGTVRAISDLFEPLEMPTVDDAALRRTAMGVADEATRLTCARAMLGSPALRRRFVDITATVQRQMAAVHPVGEDLADLGRLAVFAGRFTAADARELFPDRFEDDRRLTTFEDASWLELAKGGEPEAFVLAEPLRAALPLPDDGQGPDAGWARRFVDFYANLAEAIDRQISEGQSLEATQRLRLELPNLRAAWGRADAAGMGWEVRSFARKLAGPLLESGEWDAFDELLQAGYRASEVVRYPPLRCWLLSYEGVGAARRGDRARARERWEERVALSRMIEDRVAEADTWLDLLSYAYSGEDVVAWADWLPQAQAAVEACGRIDYAARLLALRAQERLRAGDLGAAVDLSDRALARLSGSDGIDTGFSVRFAAASTLLACGQGELAAENFADILERCIEGGRAVQSALVLSELARVLEGQDELPLANSCLRTAQVIHRRLRTRHAPIAKERFTEFRRRHPETPLAFEDVPADRWNEAADRVLARWREGREFVVQTR